MDNISLKHVTIILSIGILSLLLLAPTAAGKQGEHPIADFSYSPSSPTTENVIHFSSQVSISDGYIVDYSWDFGDGARSSKYHPDHSYSDPGVYTVSLTVTDNNGNAGTCSKNITVSNIKPEVDFSHYSSSPLKNTIQFIDESTDEDGYIAQWRWEGIRD